MPKTINPDDDYDNRFYDEADSMDDLKRSGKYKDIVNPDSLFDDPEADWEDDYEWDDES